MVLCYTKIETKYIHSSPEHMLGFSRHKSTCLILPSCGCWGSWFSPRTSPDKRGLGYGPCCTWGFCCLAENEPVVGKTKINEEQRLPFTLQDATAGIRFAPSPVVLNQHRIPCALHRHPHSPPPPIPEPVYAEAATVKRKLS